MLRAAAYCLDLSGCLLRPIGNRLASDAIVLNFNSLIPFSYGSLAGSLSSEASADSPIDWMFPSWLLPLRSSSRRDRFGRRRRSFFVELILTWFLSIVYVSMMFRILFLAAMGDFGEL